MKEIRAMDSDGIFAAPVTELNPTIASEYLKKIKNPMDFRTIMEDRKPQYQKISELQDDLILTFDNCCVFNEGDKVYYDHAILLWRNLDSIFYDVLKQVRESHSSRRRSKRKKR
mmetsp:Transcript_12541/g.19091  ORF Transcript_12541/g.19091 Transcript_12541/m.19091 type:complete len:114 (-) Transcript_12541:956-1297(-)